MKKSSLSYINWDELKEICTVANSPAKTKYIQSTFCILQEHIEEGSIYNCRIAIVTHSCNRMFVVQELQHSEEDKEQDSNRQPEVSDPRPYDDFRRSRALHSNR